MEDITNNKVNFKECNILRVEDVSKIHKILLIFDNDFNPSLSERINDLGSYAVKLYENAFVFAAMEDDKFIGFIAFYANDKNMRIGYLTQIAVKSETRNRNVGRLLLDICINVSKVNEMAELKLEVMNNNKTAIEFYKRNYFEFCGQVSDNSKYMIRKL